ncbi:hypothetical protein DWB58_27105 [candidate division KSB1 bacterium]|nr:hypothetical protein [candidate division KSB1 bacterium]MCE7944033.1 hypothetical protein [Chlorobi bacterium CHB1]
MFMKIICAIFCYLASVNLEGAGSWIPHMTIPSSWDQGQFLLFLIAAGKSESRLREKVNSQGEHLKARLQT